MKRIVSALLSVIIPLSLAACGTTGKSSSSATTSAATSSASASEPKVTLTYAEVNPEDSLMGKTAKAFKQKVEELSGGSVSINIQFSGVLGAEGDVLDTMIGGGGTVDMARISAFSLTNYGTKKTSLLSVPYTFTGREHFWKFAASDMGKKILNEPNELGLKIRGLFFAEEGFRHFFFSKEIKGIADLAGKKIRVSTDPIMTGMVQGLKASPTVVSFSELYTSLSSGVVDGAEQPIVNYQSNKFNEVAPYMILDGHTLGCAEVIITDAAWNKLSEKQKTAVTEASKYASDFNAKLSAEIEAKSMEQLKSAGAKFVEVTSKKEWQDACATVIANATKGMESDYKAIVDMGK